MTMNFEVQQLIEALAQIEEVEGILLSGSQISNTSDESSDYDIYVYSKEAVSVDKRRKIADEFFSYIELDNKYWETEDDGYLKDSNIPVEIIYRDINWIEGVLKRTAVDCTADIGYSTCFWHNFKNSVVLYDKTGILKILKEKYDVPYPKLLQQNIIKKNYPLLNLLMSSYYNQIEKALKRDDIVSINHRVAALLASYFDIIFAANMKTHPGEKKLLKIITDEKLKVPLDMKKNIEDLLKCDCSNDSEILAEIDNLVLALDVFLKQENLYLYEI